MGSIRWRCRSAAARSTTLRSYINVDSADDWQLVSGWLVGALNPGRPCPVLVLLGEQGSAKTSATRVFKRLLDPGEIDDRTAPRDERDLSIAARGARVLAYDNLSFIPEWLSDAFCRIVTGSGQGLRQLYTDDDEILFKAMRPVLINSIAECVTRPDLLDRSILVTLPSVTEQGRRDERTFWSEFAEVQPRVLGALLDAVSTALRHEGTVRIKKLPRMADFTLWVTAAEPALRWKQGSFVEAYRRNRADATDIVLESSPVVAPIFKLVEQAQASTWEGTATDLLKALEALVDDAAKKQKAWPSNAKGLSDALRRLVPALRRTGVVVDLDRRSKDKHHRRLVALWRAASPDAEAPVAPAPNPSGSLRSDGADAADAGMRDSPSQPRRPRR